MTPVQKPPIGQNYAIGCTGNVNNKGPFVQPAGYIEGTGKDLLIESLYEAQLSERMTYGVGPDAPGRLHTSGYSLSDTSRYVDLAWFDIALDENQYVIDFIAFRDSIRNIVNQLDHHVLLPTSHPLIRVTSSELEVEARFEDRRWVFPKEDCVLLPVANTTAELLARYIGQRLLEDIGRLGFHRPHRAQVGVDECQGQWAHWILNDADEDRA